MRPGHSRAKKRFGNNRMKLKTRVIPRLFLTYGATKGIIQYILLVEGRLSGAVEVDFVAVGEGIGVDLRESEDSCVRGSAVSLYPRTQWSFLLTASRIVGPTAKSGGLYSAWTNIGDNYYFSRGDGLWKD